MHFDLEYCRALPGDIEHNARRLREIGKLAMPALGLGGDAHGRAVATAAIR